MRSADPTNNPVEPNDRPTREEYMALFTAMEAGLALLDAMAGREMISVREEYRDLSNACAKARVEIRKTARADAAKDPDATAPWV